MSFTFFQSLLESLDLDGIAKSLQSSTKTVLEYLELLKESLQPLTAKTQQLLLAQLQLGEVSELPKEYTDLEAACDTMLKLYTDLVGYTATFATVSYDYPPGNLALARLQNTNVSLALASKFTQLRNLSTPQEMEKALFELVEPTVVTDQLPKTLYGRLAEICSQHSAELQEAQGALLLVLMQVSSAYVEVATARLAQDKAVAALNAALVAALNEQFLRVNEMRKRVYSARADFDAARTQSHEDDEALIAKEDALVSATEVAVVEMRRLLRPSRNVDLLKVLVAAQRDFFDAGARKLAALSALLDQLELKEESDDE